MTRAGRKVGEEINIKVKRGVEWMVVRLTHCMSHVLCHSVSLLVELTNKMGTKLIPEFLPFCIVVE